MLHVLLRADQEFGAGGFGIIFGDELSGLLSQPLHIPTTGQNSTRTRFWSYAAKNINLNFHGYLEREQDHGRRIQTEIGISSQDNWRFHPKPIYFRR